MLSIYSSVVAGHFSTAARPTLMPKYRVPCRVFIKNTQIGTQHYSDAALADGARDMHSCLSCHHVSYRQWAPLIHNNARDAKMGFHFLGLAAMPQQEGINDKHTDDIYDSRSYHLRQRARQCR